MRGFDYKFEVEFEYEGIAYLVMGSAAIECEQDGSNPVIEEITATVDDMNDDATSCEVNSLKQGWLFDAIVNALESEEWFALDIYEICKED